MRRQSQLIVAGLVAVSLVWLAAFALSRRNAPAAPAIPTMMALPPAAPLPTASLPETEEAPAESVALSNGAAASERVMQRAPGSAPASDRVILHFQPGTSAEQQAAYLQQIGGRILRQIAGLNSVVVSLPGGTEVQDLPPSPLIAVHEPDYIVTAQVDVSDSYYPQQWALTSIGVPAIWPEVNGAPAIKVAVIDSGVCLAHPDLSGRLLAGWDYVEDDATPQDDMGHGCGVAGIIAANMDNGIGIAGVAPNAQILPLRVLDALGNGYYSDVAAAIIAAADQGARVINLSLGGPNPSLLLENAVNYAASRGVTLVAAAGNQGQELVLYPAAYPVVIAVGSVNQDLQRSSFSNYGPGIDLWSPGGSVWTTHQTSYAPLSGTSFAAPYVSGVAALELTRGNTLSPTGGLLHIEPSPLNVAGQLNSIVVTTVNDELNSDADCSLREAITAANTDTAVSGCAAGDGADVITFDVTGTIMLFSGLPEITSDITISGPGTERLYLINYLPLPAAIPMFQVTAAGTFHLSEVTFYRTFAGAVWNNGGTTVIDRVDVMGSSGDGILRNSGVMTVTNSVFGKNTSRNHAGVIQNSGALTVANSVFYSNGEEINNNLTDAIVITDGTAALVNVTISNTVDSGLRVLGGDVTVQNTIIATSLQANCVVSGGTLTSLGNNIDDQVAGSCGFTHANDLPNGTDPRLNLAERYYVQTIWAYYDVGVGLLWDSPAIDAGNAAACAAKPVNNQDYRGEVRPLDGDSSGGAACDIGAFELSSGIPQSERDALVALYNALDGPNWTYQEGWLTAFNPCGWQAVTCREGHVTGFSSFTNNVYGYWSNQFSSNNNSGTLPPEIGDLPYLEFLDIGKFTGPLPASIGNLNRLRYLSVWAGASDVGPIPPEIGSLSSLEYLGLNGFTGTLPPEIGNLSKLRVLFLEDNALTGSLPPELGNLTSLNELYLGVTDSSPHNQFTGSLPPELGNLTNLVWLQIEDNQLSGSIPPELGNLRELQMLGLNNNQLTGSLPSELGNLNHLIALTLNDNQLSGPIPSEWGNLKALWNLYLNHNQLTGPIPPELGNLPQLWNLNLDHNQLTGSIPSELGNLTGLHELVLNNNMLTGPIPAALGNLSNLEWLELDQNQLTGSIPAELGNLTNLYTLQMSNNALNGEIPSTITSLVNLSDPDFGYNMLTSSDQDVLDFLNLKDPDWAETQTIAPTDVQVTGSTLNSVTLSWTPIPYTGDGGYYEIRYATNSSGPYNDLAFTSDKAASSHTVSGLLLGTTYYFKIRTFTPAHGDQQNALFSDFTTPVQGTTSTTASYCATVSEIPQAECEALVALYTSTSGSGWTNHTGWLEDDTPCDWYGVACASGHVTSVGLENNNLIGTLPAQLGNLTNVTLFKLGGNALTGGLPTALGSMTSLELLSLPDNQFSGTIPASLGDLANLKYLYLYDNQLSGNIPPQLGDLPLEQLILSRNQLSGGIPSELAVPTLTLLGLSDNQLSGSIPAELGEATALTYLALHNNQLSGAIPMTLGGLTNLEVLMLHNNRLSGAVPPEVGSLAGLQVLLIHNNALSGELPSALTNLVNLDSVARLPDLLWNGSETVDFGYNMLYSSNQDVIAFLDSKDADWAVTQTILPGDIQVVSPTSNSLELTWTPIPYIQDGGHYEVHLATTPGGPYTLHGTTPSKVATGYTLSGLQPGTTYYMVVRTHTPAHGSQQNALTTAFSAEVSGTTELLGLNAPSGLIATPIAQTQIDLSWTDNAADESAFHIERSANGVNGWSEIDTVAANMTAYSDGSLTCNTVYYYRVRAFRSADSAFSAYSGVASATTQLCPPPPAPTDLAATPVSRTQINLAWMDNAPDETAYKVEHSVDGVSWSLLVTLPADSVAHSHTGLLCNTPHHYRVRAFRAGDGQHSAYSNAVVAWTQACPPPNTPSLFNITGLPKGQIRLQWSDLSADESEFRIERSADGVSGWTQIAVVPANTTQYVDSGLVCGSTHFYRLRAYRASDSQPSGYSGVMSATTLPCPPPSVTTIGLYQGGFWQFRDSDSAWPDALRFAFASPESGWIPLIGDWDGDGVDGIGLYKDGVWLLRNSISGGVRELAFSFNPLGAGALPVVGDWNGDGIDTIGIYKDGQWFLRNSSSDGPRDYAFTFNPAGAGALPIAGDWNGDGIDTVGLYKEGAWYLHDAHVDAARLRGFSFGPAQPGWTPLAGDWDGDGVDTIGLYKDGLWRLRNSNSDGSTDIGFSFGPLQPGWLPVAGYRGGVMGLQTLGLTEAFPPTAIPTAEPTAQPSAPPIMTAIPTETEPPPTPEPTLEPTIAPTAIPTAEPTIQPSAPPPEVTSEA